MFFLLKEEYTNLHNKYNLNKWLIKKRQKVIDISLDLLITFVFKRNKKTKKKIKTSQHG